MAVRLVEYNIEYDSVDILYTRGTDTFSKIVTLRALETLINAVKGGSKTEMREEDKGLLDEIIKLGGMDWVRTEIDNLMDI